MPPNSSKLINETRVLTGEASFLLLIFHLKLFVICATDRQPRIKVLSLWSFPPIVTQRYALFSITTTCGLPRVFGNPPYSCFYGMDTTSYGGPCSNASLFVVDVVIVVVSTAVTPLNRYRLFVGCSKAKSLRVGITLLAMPRPNYLIESGWTDFSTTD